ncbi:hypothetical protein PX076_18685, partial [Klebsiella pneumoniae]|uniref:hypothetical protein n=1 Tax=Klebsiella pneumoniae TaxID=573 RepID=UPI002F41B8E5
LLSYYFANFYAKHSMLSNDSPPWLCGRGEGGLGVDSRPDHTIAETSLPLKHQVTLVKMFGLMGIAARTMLLSLWPI